MNKHLQPCVRPSRPKTSPPLLRVPPFPVACLSPRPHVKSRGVSQLPPPAVHWTCPREGPRGPSPASIPRTPRRLLTPRPPRRCSPGSAGLHLSRPFPAYWCCPEPCSWSSPLTPGSLCLEFCSFSVLLTLMKLLTSPHPSPPQLHSWPPSPARRFVTPLSRTSGPSGRVSDTHAAGPPSVRSSRRLPVARGLHSRRSAPRRPGPRAPLALFLPLRLLVHEFTA